MAPALMARTDIGTSPCPVMKMTGRSMFDFAISRWKSSPLKPGSRTSSTMQPGASGRLNCRNSSVEPNDRTFRWIERIRLSSASRTEGLSSITNTTG